jgi:putative colanic acid biosynthesis acetyltransferase WcaF
MTVEVDLGKFDNSHYRPGSKFKLGLWYLVNLFFFQSGLAYPNFFKLFLLRLFGCILGEGVVIKPRVNIKYPWFLTLGNNVWIGEGVWIDNLTLVDIGNNVCISQGSYLLCGNHNYKLLGFDLILADIVICDGCWVGANCTVCPGVIMKKNSILTVGSIAIGILEESMIYRGNPAKIIRSRKFSDLESSKLM